MRHETRDKRQATRDKRQETSDKRQETRDKRQTTSDKRQATRDKRQATRDNRQETRERQKRDKRETREGQEREKTGKRERQERETRERDKRETRETKAKNKFTHIALVRSYPTICCDPYSHRENKTSQDTDRTRQAKTTQDNTNKTHMCARETRDKRHATDSFLGHLPFSTNPKKSGPKKSLV